MNLRGCCKWSVSHSYPWQHAVVVTLFNENKVNKNNEAEIAQKLRAKQEQTEAEMRIG